MYVPTGRSRNSLSRLHIVGVCKRVRSIRIHLAVSLPLYLSISLSLSLSRFLLQRYMHVRCTYVRACISRVNVRHACVTETSYERTFDDTIYILYVHARISLSNMSGMKTLSSDDTKESVFNKMLFFLSANNEFINNNQLILEGLIRAMP